MNQASIKTAYDFMHYCRAPVWHQREIRDMKIGDTFYLGQYKRKIPDAEFTFVAEAWIEKERGIYKFYGTWTFPTKSSRPLIITYGDFKILKGGIIQFGNDWKGVKEFALVSRYLDFMVRKMSSDERKVYYDAGSSPLLRGVCVDSNYIGKRERYRHVGKSLQRYYVGYKSCIPTNQMEAIIAVGIASKQIPPSFFS